MENEKSKDNDNIKKLLSSFHQHPAFNKNQLVLEFVKTFFTDIIDKIKHIAVETYKSERITFQITPEINNQSINIHISWLINEILSSVPFGNTVIVIFESKEGTNLVINGELSCNYKLVHTMMELSNYMVFIHKITTKLQHLLFTVWENLKSQINMKIGKNNNSNEKLIISPNTYEDKDNEITDDDINSIMSEKKYKNKNKSNKKKSDYEDDEEEEDEDLNLSIENDFQDDEEEEEDRKSVV